MPTTNSPKGSAIPVRPTAAMRQQLDELVAAGFGNQTDVIRTAIDRMYQLEVTYKSGGTMKARIITKAVDSRTNRKAICAGEKGKGGELWAITYWPDSDRSVEAMERSLFDWQRQHPNVEIVGDEYA